MNRAAYCLKKEKEDSESEDVVFYRLNLMAVVPEDMIPRTQKRWWLGFVVCGQVGI